MAHKSFDSPEGRYIEFKSSAVSITLRLVTRNAITTVLILVNSLLALRKLIINDLRAVNQ